MLPLVSYLLFIGATVGNFMLTSGLDGTAMDTSLLIDYISAYAFPDDSVKISQNIVLGISLGGHAAWHCILHDPRISSAVICIGCPDYARLMSDRARLSKLPTYMNSKPPGSTFIGSNDFPQGLVEAVNKYDPAGFLWSPLKSTRPGQEHLSEVSADDKAVLSPLMARSLGNKRILNLSGGADKLVPYKCSEPFLLWLKKAIGQGGWYEQGGVVLEDMIFDGVGHMVSPEMVPEIIRFIGETMEEGTEMTAGKIGSRESRI